MDTNENKTVMFMDIDGIEVPLPVYTIEPYIENGHESHYKFIKYVRTTGKEKGTNEEYSLFFDNQKERFCKSLHCYF